MRSEVLVAVGLAAAAVAAVAWPPAPRRLGPSTPCAPAAIVQGELRCGSLPDGLRPGDRVEDGVVGRMDPDALQALAVPIDINTASVRDLESLPGIGPVIAQRIIAGRPYAEARDLLRVKGVGEKTLARIRSRAVTAH